MATETERQRLRMDLGLQATDTTSLSDATADAIYAEADESYSDTSARNAYARVLALERLMAQAVTQVDYTQNETQEKSSQIFSHYEATLTRWQKKLEDAIRLASSGVVRLGQTKRIRVCQDRLQGW